MEITTIGYGATKNIGNYNSLKLYLEAEINSDESLDECLESLRKLVSVELNLGESFSELRNDIRQKRLELEETVSALDRVQIELNAAVDRWNNLLKFFSSVDPDIGSILIGTAIFPQINFDEIDDDCDADGDIKSEF